jgi:hypothetical protein
MAIKQAGQQEQDGRYSAGYELWVSTEWIAAMELTERERERSEGRESGQSKESRVCVEDCKACKIIYNKGQAKQAGELSFVDSNRKRKV